MEDRVIVTIDITEMFERASATFPAPPLSPAGLRSLIEEKAAFIEMELETEAEYMANEYINDVLDEREND